MKKLNSNDYLTGEGSTQGSRLGYAIARLQEEGMVKNGRQFALSLDINHSTLGNALADKQALSPKVYFLMGEKYPQLNIEAIRTGEGEIYSTVSLDERLKLALQDYVSPNNLEAAIVAVKRTIYPTL